MSVVNVMRACSCVCVCVYVCVNACINGQMDEATCQRLVIPPSQQTGCWSQGLR